MLQVPERIPDLAAALDDNPQRLARRITRNDDKEFLYQRRHMTPSAASQVLSLDLPGVDRLREDRRY